MNLPSRANFHLSSEVLLMFFHRCENTKVSLQPFVIIVVDIILLLLNKLRSFIQKSGRVLRAEHPEIFIIYVKGTQDETYLKNALEGLNPDYITYYEDYNQRRGM